MRYKGHRILTEGYRLLPSVFGIAEARELKDIIDEHGHVYEPGVYDIPKQPLKVLAFSLKLILALIDADIIKAGGNELIITEKELLQYRQETLELLRAVENSAITGEDIRYQKVGWMDSNKEDELEKAVAQGYKYVCCGCGEIVKTNDCVCPSKRFMPIEQATANLRASNGKTIFEQKNKQH